MEITETTNESQVLRRCLPLYITKTNSFATLCHVHEFKTLFHRWIFGAGLDHGLRDRLVNAVPHTFCYHVTIQSTPDDSTLKPLGLIVTNTHRYPSPPRKLLGVIRHFYDALILNRLRRAIRADILLICTCVLKEFPIADIRHSIRKLFRIEENRFVITFYTGSR